MQKESPYKDNRVKTIDFRSILCSAPPTAYLDKIVEDLQRRKLYLAEKLDQAKLAEGLISPVEGLLYRGFNAARIPVLLRTGTDTTGNLCCVVESQFRQALAKEDKRCNPLSYAEEYAREKSDKPALVVYDASKMQPGGGDNFVYELPAENPSSAIVAVYVLKNLAKPKKPKMQKTSLERNRVIVRNLDDLDKYCLREARLRENCRTHPKQLELF